MTFEIALKRSLLSPGFIQFGDEKPRPPEEAHVLGRGLQKLSKGQNQKQGGQNEDEPNPGKYDTRGSRKLNSITPGEVKRAYQLYERQLTSTSYGSFIATNHFYMIELAQRENVPAAIFGRVNVCLPGDGQVQNVREMELSFPQPGMKPEAVILRPRDIATHGNIQGYCIRVKILASEEEYKDFIQYERLFREAGFVFDFNDNTLDLLELSETDHDSLPWFHVIGSRWFAEIPVSLQQDVKFSLWKLSGRETLLLNYHPDHTPIGIKKLNDELGYQYRLSDFLLTDPKTPQQTLHFVRTVFEKVFLEPSNKSIHLSNRQDRIA
ncbi:MAG: hypothetical protein HXY35_06765 [Chloroflexi bacterium]|nr:hypothetical protein [Chloroflexota bacterium]